jgi:glutaredoxin 3
MNARVLFFTQPGCFFCELMKTYLEAREVAYEERDISTDSEARRQMVEDCGSDQTPTLLILFEETAEIVAGFDPERLDRLLAPAPSSDAVTES